MRYFLLICGCDEDWCRFLDELCGPLKTPTWAMARKLKTSTRLRSYCNTSNLAKIACWLWLFYFIWYIPYPTYFPETSVSQPQVRGPTFFRLKSGPSLFFRQSACKFQWYSSIRECFFFCYPLGYASAILFFVSQQTSSSSVHALGFALFCKKSWEVRQSLRITLIYDKLL